MQRMRGWGRGCHRRRWRTALAAQELAGSPRGECVIIPMLMLLRELGAGMAAVLSGTRGATVPSACQSKEQLMMLDDVRITRQG